jgi:hypothetical protein
VVLESRTLEWFAARVDTIDMHCNAHRDARTTVARHLLDRERRGEHVQFDSEEARALCVTSDMLWELSVRHADGRLVHVASSSFEDCVALLQRMDGIAMAHSAAA